MHQVQGTELNNENYKNFVFMGKNKQKRFKNKKELLEALGVREKDIDIKLYKVKKGDIKNGI